MALTPTQQLDAYRFFAVAFDAAPGSVYMSQIADAYEAGMTTLEIVEVYTTKPQFLAIYPSFLTNEQFATRLVDNVVDSSASVAAKAQAVTDITAALNGGWSRGEVIYQVFNNLANKPFTDPTWGGTAKQLSNQVEVAKYYTEVLLGNSTDLEVLQSLLADVDQNTDVSTAAAKQAIIDEALNTAPSFAQASITVNVAENQSAVATVAATDANGDALTYSITGGADAAKFAITAGGVLTFASAPNFEAPSSSVGTNTYTVQVTATDVWGATASQNVTINVGNVNEAPTSNDSTASGDADTNIAGTVSGADVDGDSLTYSLVTGPAHGTVLLNANGTYVYSPNAGYVGADSFTFRANDGSLTSGAGTVSITVNMPVQPEIVNLTSGLDIIQTGDGADEIFGNNTTLNAGDFIDANGGFDTLQVEAVVGDSGVNFGNATVRDVENMLIRTQGDQDPSEGGDQAQIGFTNWDGELQQVKIQESTSDVRLQDLQSVPLVIIDDMTGNTHIDVDAQIAAGNSDAINLEIREIGESAEAGGTGLFGGKPTVTVDDALETLNIEDQGTSATESNFILASDGTGTGFTQVNIADDASDTARSGVDLTIEDVASTGETVTVDSTAYSGDLIIDVDGVDTLNSGIGNDEVYAGDAQADDDERTDSPDEFEGEINTNAGDDSVYLGMDLSGDVTTGSGDDLVTLADSFGGEGSFEGADGWGDMLSGASIDTGTGDDRVRVGNMEENSIVNGGDGNDNIQVLDEDVEGNGYGDFADKLGNAIVDGGSGNDTIGVADDVHGVVRGGDGNDSLSTGGDVDGQVDGGAGDDWISIGDDVGEDEPFGNDASDVLGGEGNDTITVGGDLEDDGVVDAGTGNDNVTIMGDIDANDDGVLDWGYPTPAQLLLGEGNDLGRVYGEVNGLIQAGAGNDTVKLNDDSTDDANNGDLNDGTVDLGDGDDLMWVTNADIQTSANVDGGDGADELVMRTYRFDGYQEANIFAVTNDVVDPNNITDIETLSLNVDPIVTLPDAQHAGVFNVNLDAIDSTLDTINIRDNDGTARANLENIEGEQINIWSNGNYNGAWGIAGDWDVRVDANSRNQNSTTTLNVALWGAGSYDVKIKDADDFTTLNLENNDTSGARSVKLDGDDGVGNNTTLMIGGSGTGPLTIMRSAQNTVDGSEYAGDVYLQVEDEEHPDTQGDTSDAKTITLGDGNDYVDFTKDYLDADDKILLGGGRDTLAIDNSVRDLTPNDQDGVFQDIDAEILETNGSSGGVLEVTVEDDLLIDTLHVLNDRNNTSERGNVDFDIDEDFNDQADSPDLVTVHVLSSDIDIDNGADVDMDLFLWSDEGYSNADPFPWLNNGGGAGGAGANFDETGDGEVDVFVAVRQGGGATNMSNDEETADAGNVELTVEDGEIDSLTFLDTQQGENGLITVKFDDDWVSNGDLTVDASGVVNNDATILDPNTDTGGMLFFGIMEDDAELEILGTQNDDTIMGGQDNDEIYGNDGNDTLWGDPMLGQPVAPGEQGVGSVDFDETADVEAGDSYEITVNGVQFSWTADSDNDTVADAVTSLAAQINGANVDADLSADVAAVADTTTATITITGIDIDDEFGTGYALGESFTVTAAAINRPTATVNFANEAVDDGDNARITIDGTPYNSTAGALSTIGTVQQGLVDAINSGSQMTAELGSVVLRGNAPNTAYELSAEWAPDLVSAPSEPATVTVTFTGLEAGETATVFFAGGVSVAAANDVASLVTAINGNPTVSTQWTASAIGDVLTLTAVDAGATPPSLAFLSAGISGGNGGSVVWESQNGADAVVRTDNTDPTITASEIAFTFADPSYDAGDIIVVTVDGLAYSVTLPTFPIPVPEQDENHDGPTVATVVAAGLNADAAFVAAGLTASDDGAGTLTITTTDGAAATVSVGILDLEVNGTAGPSNEQVTVDFATLTDADGAYITIGPVTVQIDSQGTAAATLAALAAGITGAGGYTATVVGTNIELASDASGVEPDVDGSTITAGITSDGGTVTVTPTAGSLAVPAEEVIDFGAVAVGDAVSITIGGTEYIGQGATVNDAMASLVQQINDAGTGWTAVAAGTVVTLSGPADGTAPAQAYNSAALLADTGDAFGTAVILGQIVQPEIYTVTVTGSFTSLSVTFDTNDNNSPDVLDTALTAPTTAELATLINGFAGIGSLNGGDWTAVAVDATTLTLTGPADGSGGANEPVLATISGGPGFANVALTQGAVNVPTPWQQVVTLAELTIPGDDGVLVALGDGTTLNVDISGAATEAAALQLVADAVDAAVNGGADLTVAVNDVANTITLTGPADGTDPATFVGAALVYTSTPIASVSTAPVPAVPVIVGLDFTNLDASNESATVTFANGESFTVLWNTDAATTLLDLAAAINADTDGDAAGDVAGATGWTASAAASTLTLTGPADGTAAGIGFTSAQIVATSTVAVTEDQESWENADNNNPIVTVVSGEDNGEVTVANVDGDAAPAADGWGNDAIWGGTGNDTILGMSGNDTLNGDSGADEMWGGEGNDVMNGGTEGDELYGEEGNDNLNGNEGADYLDGGDGNDVLNGGAGAWNDTLVGGAGNDNLNGGEGNDVLDGDGGQDVMTGGSGGDTFVFRGNAQTNTSDSSGSKAFADSITDFSVASDVIDLQLTDILGNPISIAGKFYDNVNGGTELTAALIAGGGEAGRIVFDADVALLYVDTNGDGAIAPTSGGDLVINLVGLEGASLSQANFM